MIIRKERNDSTNEDFFSISLNDKSIDNTTLDQDNNKKKEIKLNYLEKFSLNVAIKSSIKFENSKKIMKLDNGTITEVINSDPPYDLIIVPIPITPSDTLFLYFPNPDQESVLEVVEGTQ